MRELLNWKSVIIYVILPFVISAYAPEIRRLLEAGLIRKPRQWRLARLKYKLRLLEQLHNSPYDLLLHFMWNVVFVSEFILAYELLVLTVKLFKPDVPLGIPQVVVAGIYGRVVALRDTVFGLYDYDNEIAKLRVKVAAATPTAEDPMAATPRNTSD